MTHPSTPVQESSSSTQMFPAGTFLPDPQAATIATMVFSQAKIEAKLFLRHGEQLLLSFVIPLGMLLAIRFLPLIDDPHPLDKGFPLMLAIAAMSSGFTGQAISLAFDRRYGALKRTGASGSPAWAIIAGKVLGVVAVSCLQVILLSGTAFILGWRTTLVGFLYALIVFFFGVATFTALGMAMGGTLSSEIVLGLSNLIWVILVGIAAYHLFKTDGSSSAFINIIPSIALTDGLKLAFARIFPLTQLLWLSAWLIAGVATASKWFKFA